MKFDYRLVACGAFLAFCASAGPAAAQRLRCDLRAYREQPGLSARFEGSSLTAEWDGDAGQHLRMRLSAHDGAPVIEELALRNPGGVWATIVADARPEFAVTTALRRMSNQQLRPLRDLGVPITQDVVDRYRWDPFWDAPLDLTAAGGRGVFGGNPPPPEGLPGTDQPGLPRKPTEIAQAKARFSVTTCSVRTDGARLVIALPGVMLGVFSGRLQYTIFRGTNLIRQEIVGTTDRKWVAYKFSAGLGKLSRGDDARVRWRDISGRWQADSLNAAPNVDPMPLAAANRLVTAETGKGSLSLLPEPHRFFWAREVAINMAYVWLRKDADGTYAIGIRQNEKEDDSEDPANWALYSARPGTEQRMPVYLYPTLTPAEGNVRGALAFTHDDTYKPLPGYQVMNHHYHMDLGQRLIEAGSLDRKLPDLVALKALGINIVSQIDSIILRDLPEPREPAGAGAGRSPGVSAPLAAPPGAPAVPPRPRPDQLQITDASVRGARIHSDANFLILANQEIFDSPFGGHTDVLFSHPVYWDRRKPGQPLTERSEQYGQVYHIGSADDLMTMLRQEDAIASMPHPRTKGSTGFPDAIKDKPFFGDSRFDGVGMRWGMGLDGSERRLCDYRCWPLLDDMSNWMVDQGMPLKHILAISEVRHIQPGDDIYSSQPITYLKLAKLPSPDDVSPIVKALQAGDSFWSTGEVLIPSWSIRGSGDRRTIVADVEWTFPLEFVEIVWGDGKTTGRKIISTTDLPPNSSKRFEIPIDVRGKKWIRFAAWDNAANGAVVQPVRIGSTPSPRPTARVGLGTAEGGR